MSTPTVQFNSDEFSKKSEEFYATLKEALERSDKGKYVAVDYGTKKYWIGETASDAINSAKKDFPDKVFYLIQIGSLSTFSIQSFRFTKKVLNTTRHGFVRARR